MPPLSIPPKTRRCYFFREDGEPRHTPRGRGCPRSTISCNFAHPSEREWASADSLHPPAYIIDDDQKMRSPSPPPGRRRSRSRTRGGELVAPSPSRASFDSHERRPPLSPINRRASLTDRGRARLASDSISSSPAAPSDPRSQPASRTVSSAVPVAAPLPVAARSPPPRPPSPMARPIPPQLAPPPRPPAPPAPPPPLPAPPRKELTEEERRTVWLQRVSLMADAATARNEIIALDQTIQKTRALTLSERFPTLPPAAAANITARLADTERQWNERKQFMDSAIQQLLATDFWPMPLPQDAASMAASTRSALDAEVQELQKSVQDHQQTLLEVTRLLNERPVVVVPSQSQPAAMDVDESGTRRPAQDPEDVREEEINHMNDQLDALWQRMHNVQLMVETRDEEALHELLPDDLEGRLERLEARVELIPEPAVPPPVDPVTEARLARIEQENSLLHQDVTALDGVLTASIEQSEQLRRENEELRNALDESKANWERNKAEVDALRLAMEMQLAQAREEPAYTDLLAKAVEAHVTNAVLGRLDDRLTTLRQEFDKRLAAHRDDLTNAVWPQLQRTLHTVDNIWSWMQRAAQEGSAAAPLQPLPHGAGLGMGPNGMMPGQL